MAIDGVVKGTPLVTLLGGHNSPPGLAKNQTKHGSEPPVKVIVIEGVLLAGKSVEQKGPLLVVNVAEVIWAFISIEDSITREKINEHNVLIDHFRVSDL